MTALALLALAGCGSSATPAASQSLGSTYTSKTLSTAYPDALSVPEQLMLGTLRLEETHNAVTAEQAQALLPLWQALQGSVLKVDAERNGVLAQIEKSMTPAQLEAIASMQLTQQDLADWQPGPGVAPGSGGGPFGAMSEEQRAALRATAEAGGLGGPGAGGGPFGAMSEEQRAALRATAEAGGMGGLAGRGQFGGLSDEQRAALRATAEAGGMTGRPAGAHGGTGQSSFLLNALIRLLSQRAAPGATPPAAP